MDEPRRKIDIKAFLKDLHYKRYAAALDRRDYDEIVDVGTNLISMYPDDRSEKEMAVAIYFVQVIRRLDEIAKLYNWVMGILPKDLDEDLINTMKKVSKITAEQHKQVSHNCYEELAKLKIMLRND